MSIPFTKVVTDTITDIGDLTIKGTPVGADVVLIKDSTDGTAKGAEISTLPGGTGSSVEVKIDGVQLEAAVASINFVGMSGTNDGSHAVTITDSGGGAVDSVFGRTGDVIATNDDYTASQITAAVQGALVGGTVHAQLGELDAKNTAQDDTVTDIQTDVTNAQADIAALEALTAAATDAATAGTLMKRDASSRAKVADPSAATDIANKQYADALGVSVATASTIMRRDASGRAQVATPSASGDIATMGYVDSKIPLAGGDVFVPITFNSSPNTFTDVPSAATESFGGNRRFITDLTTALKFRVVAHVTTAVANSGVLRIRYSINSGGAWTSVTTSTIDLTTEGLQAGTEVDVPAEAKTASTWLALETSGGNGAADPAAAMCSILIRYPAGASSGTMTGAAIVAAIDSQLGSTQWHDPVVQSEADTQGMPDEFAQTITTGPSLPSSWVIINGGNNFLLPSASTRKTQGVFNNTTVQKTFVAPAGVTLVGSGIVAPKSPATFKYLAGSTQIWRWTI